MQVLEFMGVPMCPCFLCDPVYFVVILSVFFVGLRFLSVVSSVPVISELFLDSTVGLAMYTSK